MAETIHLLGGYADGRTYPLCEGYPVPRRWHVEVPVELTVTTYLAAQPPVSAFLGFENFDEYVPALAQDHRPSRNDRGELVYRLALSVRGDKPVHHERKPT